MSAKKVIELKTLPEVYAYWKDCLQLHSDYNDMQVAGFIVGVVSNNNFETWYSEGNGESVFVDVFDRASELEIPDGSPAKRAQTWAVLRTLLDSV